MAFDTGGRGTAADLLAAIADAAVAVDEAGGVTGWNAAAGARFSIAADAMGRDVAEVVGSTEGAVSLALDTGAGGGRLLVWRRPGTPPTADDIALQKADALGRLAGGVSHDIANRFMAIQGTASLLATDPVAPRDVRETAGVIESESAETLRVLREFFEATRCRPPTISAIHVGHMVREVLDVTANALVDAVPQVTIADDLPDLEADAARLRQALLAVTLNAVEAMGGRWTPDERARGRFAISGRTILDGDATLVRLVFEDSAPVVTEAERDGLFRGGGGRATRDLAVAHALIESCGGRLTYVPLPGGNRFLVDLPCMGSPLPVEVTPEPEPEPEPEREPEPEPVPAEPATVLVCDDDDSVRAVLVRFVATAGYRTIAATGGREALERLQAETIDIVISDQRMAGMTGVELYRRAVELRPALRTRFILTSGDANSDVLQFADREGIQVLAKPFTGADVIDAVRRLTAGR